MRNVRYILAVLTVALISVAIPAQAEEQVGCVTIGIEWGDEDDIYIDDYWFLSPDNGVNAAIVGDFLWLTYNSDGSDDSWNNVLSIEIPYGVPEYTACITMHDVEGPDIVEGPESDAVIVEVAELVEEPDIYKPELVEPAVKVVPVLTVVEDTYLVEEWVAAKGGWWIL